MVLCADEIPDLSDDELAVATVPGLCAHPRRLQEYAEGAEGLVVGVCSGEYSLGAIQKETRSAGLDPLGVELVDLRMIDGDVGRLQLMLAAAVARADAFAGSGPEHSKLGRPEAVSRRELFTRADPHYLAAPGIVDSVCAAGDGCRACVDICPVSALSWAKGRVLYDKTICEPCGLCVTRCPTGAAVNPAYTPAQLESEITALLDPDLGPPGDRGIVFICSRGGGVEAAPDWYPVNVPCTAMVTSTWLLAPLAMGAGSVAAVPCGDSGCPLSYDGVVERHVATAHAILDRFELGSDRVGTAPATAPLPALGRVEQADVFGPLGGAEVLKALALVAEKPDAFFRQIGSPVGVIEIDADACTGCSSCAQTCPTRALGYEYRDDEVLISFDAGRCTACRQCLPQCPEARWGAITLVERVDVAALSRGREVLYTAETARCRQCGDIIASAPTMERIGSLLGDDHPATNFLASYCIKCRRTARAGF